MTITRIWQSGGETGNINEFDGVNRSGALNVFEITSTQKKTGTYSFHNSVLSIGWAYGYVTVPVTRQVRTGVFHRGEDSGFTTHKIIGIFAGATELVSLKWNPINNLELLVAGVLKDTANNYGSQEWKHLAIDVKIDASVGWVKVYKDGIEILSFTGNTGNTDIDHVRVGIIEWTGNDANSQWWDDMYVDDATGESSATPLSIKRFYGLKPNGAGNYTNWTPSAGANYTCVDEIPPSDADYVAVSGVDILDSYAMETHTLDANESIIAVIPTVRAKRENITEEIAVGTRYSSTDVVGSDQEPGIPYAYFFDRQITKPGGGDWDQTSIDGFEAIIKSRGSY
jgi:hypothetical protein